jgi:hypothetical protein
MSIVLEGSTSGSVTLQEPAVAGTTVLDLPATSGTLVVTGGAQTIEFAAGSASTPSITTTGDTNTGIFFPAADTMAFSEGGAEVMRITSSGNVLVGTTSTSSFDGGFRVFPTGSGNSMQVVISNTGGGLPFLINRSDDGNIIDFRRAGTNVGTISVTTTNTAYNTSSDYRLKENITPMTGALNKIALLKPCTYTWKETGTDGQGFIAHELQEVFPDAVHGEKDAVNEDGSVKAQGIDTSYLVATLTSAIQELKAELDTVKAEVQALKGVA